MLISRLVWAVTLIAVVVAGVVTAPTTANASTAAVCTTWRSLERVHPGTGRHPYYGGTLDTSISLFLQDRTCAGQRLYRIAVTNHRATGKRDVAVGLKRGDSHCDMANVRTLGVYHPRVPAGTTWASPAINQSGYSNRYIYADMHVTYANADYWGRTDPCRTIP